MILGETWSLWSSPKWCSCHQKVTLSDSFSSTFSPFAKVQVELPEGQDEFPQLRCRLVEWCKGFAKIDCTKKNWILWDLKLMWICELGHGKSKQYTVMGSLEWSWSIRPYLHIYIYIWDRHRASPKNVDSELTTRFLLWCGGDVFFLQCPRWKTTISVLSSSPSSRTAMSLTQHLTSEQ